jgi:hypothetical protein
VTRRPLGREQPPQVIHLREPHGPRLDLGCHGQQLSAGLPTEGPDSRPGYRMRGRRLLAQLAVEQLAHDVEVPGVPGIPSAAGETALAQDSAAARRPSAPPAFRRRTAGARVPLTC